MSKTKTRLRSEPPYRVHRSPVHGSGLFAVRAIRKGALISEYVGERISHEEADRRHADKADDDNHTFLFTIDAKTVVDGGVGGNDARFINHSCDPNCEVLIDDGRLLVEALRAIAPGEELSYDYNINRGPEDAPNIEEVFGCRCGTKMCRGTMLMPPKKKRKKSKGAKAKGKAGVAAKKKRKSAPTAKAPRRKGVSRATKPKKIPRAKARAKKIPRAKASAKKIPRTKARATKLPRTKARATKLPRAKARAKKIPRTVKRQR